MKLETQATIDGLCLSALLLLPIGWHLKSTTPESAAIETKPSPVALKTAPISAGGKAIVNLSARTVTIAGETHSIVYSKFIPKGTYTIGKAYWDPVGNGGRGRWASPFQIVNWRSMPDDNPLKSRVRKLEEKTGIPQTVAYSVHGGDASDGCVTIPQKAYDRLKNSLEGTTIEIR